MIGIIKSDRQVKDKEIGNFNDFTSKEEYLELLKLIKQYIPAIAKEKIGTQNNTPTSPLNNQKSQYKQINP